MFVGKYNIDSLQTAAMLKWLSDHTYKRKVHVWGTISQEDRIQQSRYDRDYLFKSMNFATKRQITQASA